jgi:hypothetical protein
MSDSENSTVWTPESSDDEKLKDLFENKVGKATESVLEVTKTEDNKKVKKFILQSHGFFGKEHPNSRLGFTFSKL